MKRFSYKAIDNSANQAVGGIVEALSEESAQKLLKENNLSVIILEEQPTQEQNKKGLVSKIERIVSKIF